MRTLRASFVLVIGILAAAQGLAHHTITRFDRSRIVDVEGEVVELTWANPHVRMSLRVTEADGSTTDWHIEGQSVSNLGRMGMTADLFAPGTTVKLAGWPSRTGEPELGMTNALLAGQEYVTFTTGTPRWNDDVLDNPLVAGGVPSEDKSIFRVWSADFDERESNAGGFWRRSYPLTEFARSATTDYFGGQAGDCDAKGMPTTMEQPYPLEFVQEGEKILLRMEELDTVRTIYMNGEAASRSQPDSILGRSWGEWDGNTLVVMTEDIRGWPYFDKRQGIPQSDQMSLVERFSPSEDGSRLDYEMVVTDPVVFTEPFTLDRFWVWRPGERVRPFNCTPG